ncbi:MarR family winged helix-turn-helix transcriptional regulator [Limoniibacter endophyticus]|uniref:MarR family transcriptional regulator n=1 Tax=Limoniibacter endophyticus TaxID=1565040 RepID=A0A8J3GFX2_9HYPH|nr:MarR family transcriptional regulator [Limoniibacter endophyticus]GHC65393.1 MarR family transcriptional regulator [Limoniibacter endophyticus]
MNCWKEKSFAALIFDANRLLHKRFEARIATHGLSAAQWRLLASLVQEEGAAQARLAQLLDIEPISVSRLLDRMERGGWIERRPHPEDRRMRLIYATDQGREAFAEIKAVAASVYEEALEGLSAQDRETMLTALATVNGNLNE